MDNYLIDANVFITAFNGWYPMNKAPGFWDMLASNAKSGLFCSIDKVYEEITKRNQPELIKWAKK